ncbi:MAG: hypothetical protein F9K15_24255 [Zoogloea sp.]|nr:MAG: hypothetical protein F9K15_24255 [Zoogloea sp.]
MLLLSAGIQHLPLMKDAESVVEQRRGPFSMTRYSFIVMLKIRRHSPDADYSASIRKGRC